MVTTGVRDCDGGKERGQDVLMRAQTRFSRTGGVICRGVAWRLTPPDSKHDFEAPTIIYSCSYEIDCPYPI